MDEILVGDLVALRRNFRGVLENERGDVLEVLEGEALVRFSFGTARVLDLEVPLDNLRKVDLQSD